MTEDIILKLYLILHTKLHLEVFLFHESDKYHKKTFRILNKFYMTISMFRLIY